MEAIRNRSPQVNQNALSRLYCYVIMVSEAGSPSERPAVGFDSVAGEFAGDLYAIAFTILRDRGDAQDAVQTTFELAWREWDGLRDADSVRPWLRRTCVREAVRSRGWIFRWI